MNAVATITDEIYGLRHGFEAVLTDRSINFEREAGFAVQAISASDYALKIAMSNRQSVVNAVTNIAAIGISLNPAKKQAYLVPRDGKICLDISYMGLMDLAMNTGSIRWAQAALVCEKDAFVLNGFDKPPTHTFNPFSKDRGEVVGVYVVVKTADGEYLTHTMDAASVHAIRDRSSAWKAWVKDKRSCPWVTDPGEMMKKTCVKQAYKYWPKTERLEKAIHHLNTDGGEGLTDITPAAPPAPPPLLLDKAREAALQGVESLRTWWEGRQEAERVALLSEFRSLKAAAKRADEDAKQPKTTVPDGDGVIDMEQAA